MTAILRKVEKTFTFEDQRVEINELAWDVYNLKLNYFGLSDFRVDKNTNNTGSLGDLSYAVGVNATTGEDQGVFTYTPPDLDNFLTDLGDAIVDGDFLSEGLMRRDAVSGDYSIVTDNSTDWNNAHSWGDHKLASYLKSDGTYWDLTTSAYETSRLDQIGNVTLTSIQPNEFLKWNGNKWVNSTVPDAQIQSDWDQTDNTLKDFIKNKPVVFTGTTRGFVPASTLSETTKFLRSDGSWEDISTGEDNVQSDWNITQTSDDAFIKNKPPIFTGTVRGFVPANSTNSSTKFLRADGSWVVPNNDNDNTTYQIDAGVDGNNVKINLIDSDSNIDPILITAGSNVTFTDVSTAGFKINASVSAGSGATKLDELSDVSINTPSLIAGNVLWYTGGNWVNRNFKIFDINDVTQSGLTVANDDVLQWNGSNWTNKQLSIPDKLSDLSDVSNATPGDGQVLKWDQAQGLWRPKQDLTSSGSGGIGYTDLSVTVNPVGTADLEYDDAGTFTYTPPDLTDYLTSVALSDLTDVNIPTSGITNDKIIKYDSTTQKWVLADDETGGSTTVTTSDTAPSNPSDGDLWWKSDEGQLKVYYEDADSSQWVDTAGGGGSSSTGGATVTTSDTAPANPSDGDLWWKSDEGQLKVYYEDVDGSSWVDTAGGGGSSSTGATVTTSDTAPTNPSDGDLWWKSNEGQLKVYYTDVDGSSWVDTAGGGGGVGGGATVTVSDSAPTNPSNGDLWWKSNEGQLKVYYQDADSPQWVDTAGSGTHRFIDSPDTPSTYVAGKWLKVNAAGTALEFTDEPVGGSGSSGANVTTSDTAPTNPSDGDLWYKSDEGQLKVYYEDADSSQWVDTSGGGGLQNVVEDTTPQLGGNLDVQTREINTSTTNGNIKLTPNGTGVVEVKGAGGNDGTLQLNCSANSHGVKIKSPPHSAGASYTLTLPNDDGSSGDYLKSDGSGNLSWDTPSSANTLDEVLAAGNTSTNWFSVGGVNTDGTSSSSVFRQKVHIRDGSVGGDRISLNPANGYGISTHDGCGLYIANMSTNVWRWTVDGGTGDMYVRYGGIKDKDGDLGSPGQILSSTGTQINWIDSGTAANVTTSDTAPTSPSNGDLWWDSTSGNLKIRYEDGDSNQWVDATSTLGAAGSSGANVTISLTAPTTPNSGDLWWKSDEGQLKIFYDDTQGTPSTQWVDAVNITSDDTSNTLTSHFGQQSFPRFTFDKLTPFANTIPGNQRYGVYRSANKTNRTGADLSTIFDGDNTTFVKITDHETNLFTSNGSSQGTFMLVFDTPITDIEEIRLGMDGWGSPGYTGVGVSGAIWNGGTNAGKQSEEGSLLGRIDAPYAGLTGSAQEVIIFEGSPMTLTYLMFTAWDDPNTQNPASHGNWSAGTASDFITNLYYIKIRKTGGELVELTYDINQDPSALDEYVLDQWYINDGVTITPAPPAPLSTAGAGRGVERVGFPFELVGSKGMAVDSNGIWTFPSPGIWKLDLSVPFASTQTSHEYGLYLEYTDNNGSNWHYIANQKGMLTANGYDHILRIAYTLNIKDITKQKIRINTVAIANFFHPTTSSVVGDGSISATNCVQPHLIFEKTQRVNATY